MLPYSVTHHHDTRSDIGYREADRVEAAALGKLFVQFSGVVTHQSPSVGVRAAYFVVVAQSSDTACKIYQVRYNIRLQ